MPIFMFIVLCGFGLGGCQNSAGTALPMGTTFLPAKGRLKHLKSSLWVRRVVSSMMLWRMKRSRSCPGSSKSRALDNICSCVLYGNLSHVLYEASRVNCFSLMLNTPCRLRYAYAVRRTKGSDGICRIGTLFSWSKSYSSPIASVWCIRSSCGNVRKVTYSSTSLWGTC